MYPFVRLAWQSWKARRAAKLDLLDTHISQHLCWPWDLDPWVELNNGRTLTLYDLGRMPMITRIGLVGVLREQGWGITIAGSNVRYRRRIRMFDQITMVSRVVGWDHRFFYIDQSMWVRGQACSQAVLRAAVTSAKGIVAPDQVMDVTGRSAMSPDLPGWVQGWIRAEDQRIWPPIITDEAKAHL